jgi:hypothetical protein
MQCPALREKGYAMRSDVYEWAEVDGGTWMKTDYYASDNCV